LEEFLMLGARATTIARDLLLSTRSRRTAKVDEPESPPVLAGDDALDEMLS